MTSAGLATVLAILSAYERAGAQGDGWLAPEESVKLGIDSGFVSNTADESRVIFSAPIRVPGAAWLRIVLDDAVLPAANSQQSYIRIRSELDGASQILDGRSLIDWRGVSAYFNGDEALLELVAPPHSQGCRIVVHEARRDAPAVDPRNTCGPTDDRMPSTDTRAARLLPIGCTGWLIDDANYCFLSAGHCATGGGLQVVEFNVPLSTSGGSMVHPPPSDQYAVDPASVQFAELPIVIGNDWTYFGVFANSTTGQTPFEAQHAAFHLADAPISAQGQTLRKTGFGTTTSPLPNAWNLAQKTVTGPILTAAGTTLTYVLDSSGGDSGSPVMDATNEVAIGIHTNGGCNTAGYNSGCSVMHPGLRAALADPKGVCKPRFFDVTYPDSRPIWVQTIGGSSMRIMVHGRNGHQPALAGSLLHCDTGGGFQTFPILAVSGQLFRAVFPVMPCAADVRYFVTFQTLDGREQRDPPGASDSYHAISAYVLTTVAAYDFETTAGWSVQNINVTGGAWARGIPAGDGTRGDPTTDYDGSGQCWLTGNAPGDSDVDGGPTRLLSPSWNLSAAARPFVAYARWFTNDNQDADRLTVELSNNFGQTWTTAESVPDTVGWVYRYVEVSPYVAPTNLVRLRFSVADEPNNSRTEAAVDAVRVFDLACPPPGVCRKGDVNLDGRLNGADVAGLTQILVVGGQPGTAAYCAADANADGAVDVDDLSPFLAVILADGP